MIERLERSLSRFAIPGLVRYVVALNALVLILFKIAPKSAHVLALTRACILRGELWRLASGIFLPTTPDYSWIILYLMYTSSLGSLLG